MLRITVSLVVVLTCIASMAWQVHAQSSPGALRIVVIEGEDAVNIVQQKTAVAPVVEVRDRNDQPVAGATVRFAIRAGKATFGGPRTLAVTTNSAGRAAVTTLTPTCSGVLQISATAAFQGQTAAVTIVQTNVMTAAAAGGAGAGAGAGGAGAGGGGGGLSTTTISLVGAAAGGAVIVAKELTKGPAEQVFVASISGPLVYVFDSFCAGTNIRNGRTETVTGTLRLTVTESDGAVSGTAEVPTLTRTVASNVCPGGLAIGSSEGNAFPSTSISGTTGNITFRTQQGPGGAANRTDAMAFTGSLANGVVTGTLTYTASFFDQVAGNATGTFPLTAR